MTQQATLRELVKGAVEGFLVTDTKFSVHDVTQSIRHLVNSGAVEVPTLKVSGQAFNFEITHEDVKHYFTELYDDSQFSQQLTRNFNGRYFEYQGINTASPATAMLRNALNALGNASSIAIPAQGKSLNFANKYASAAGVVTQVASAAGKLGRTEVVNRVRMYLQNCSRRGVTPTNRQIQSAIKRNGKSTGWGRGELDQIRVDINNGTI